MYHALTSLGAILSPASPQFLTEEVHYQLEASEVSPGNIDLGCSMNLQLTECTHLSQTSQIRCNRPHI